MNPILSLSKILIFVLFASALFVRNKALQMQIEAPLVYFIPHPLLFFPPQGKTLS